MTVDFIKYQHGWEAIDNTLTVGVKSVNQYDAGDGFGSPVTRTWSEDQADASTTGTNDRVIFNMADLAWGNGFRIAMSGLIGVAIKKIYVLVDTRPQQGV